MPNLGAPEIMLILLVVVLLFGAKKLPELARGSGRALRIFKSETKGLMDDDKQDSAEPPATDAHGRPLGQIGTTGTVSPDPVTGSHATTRPADEASSREPRA